MDSFEQAGPGQPNYGQQQGSTPVQPIQEQQVEQSWDPASLLAGALQGMSVSDAPQASTQTTGHAGPSVARSSSQSLQTPEQQQEDDRTRSQVQFPLHGVPNLAAYPPPSGSLGSGLSSTDSAYQMQQQMQQASRLMAVLQPTGGAQSAVPRPANDFTQLGQVQMVPAAGYTRIGYQPPQTVQPTALVRPVTQTGYVSPPPSLQYTSSSATTLPFSTSNSSLPRSQRNSQRLRQQGGRGSGEGGSSGTLPDVTVEDLLRMVLALQPNERTIDAVGQGLHCLDSSATAALLKELSKQGQVKRAFEIFDWLRQLPPTHALASLCDLYTYTTMIAQCGSAAQLRKALELVAEMRARSITCNVHTYSALMNVCMKANELDVALDVFKQMQDAGLVPNLVTYNILIDVHVKKGMWDEAIRALDAIQQQGIQAEARTYNTVISACSKAGHFDRALRVYQHMHDAGVEPSTTTYTAVIGVYGRIGQLDKCLDVYHEMVKHGCERNVITYSSLISACEKVAQWQVALELYDIMRREGCRPNTVTFNSLIAACAHGNKWEKAGELFDQMAGCGCKPDAVTYTVLIGTYEKCQQWQTAVAAWEMMTANGFHPDAAVYYSLLEVLWSSGIVLAQARALQLWAAANRSGQLRVYTNVNSTTRALQYSMVTPKPGVAACTVLCWLLELRNKLLKDESSSTQPYSVVVTLQRTRTTRSDSTPSMAAHEAVRCLLLGASSPLQVVLQPASTLLTASSKDLIEWLGSTSFAELTYILQVASVQQWSVKAIAQEVGGTSSRCAEAFAAVRKLEAKQGVCSAPYNPQQRPQIVGMALQYSQSIGLAEEAAYDGLALFDRVLAANGGAGAAAARWPLCLVCCLVLCARHGAAAPAPGQQTQLPWQSHEGVQAATGFSVEELVSMERNIIVWLNGDLTIISPLRVLLLYQESLGFFAPEFRPADRTTGDLSALLSRTASSPVWLSVRPSLLAAGLLAALRNIKGILPVWPYTLQALTGLALEGGELPACIAQVEAVLQ